MTSRTLANAIQREGLTGTAAEIRAALAAEVIGTDSTRRDWTYVSGLLLTAGFTGEQVDAFYNGLQLMPGGVSLRAAMLSSGADFSLEPIQAGIDAARGQLGPLADVLLSIGKPRVPRWQRLGLHSLPSESDITAAIAEIDRVTTLRAMIATINTAIVDGETVDAVRQQIAGE